MSEPTWWTSLHARRGGRGPQIGALVLVLSLLGVTGVVWASPRVPTVVSDPMSAQEQALLAENEALRNSLDARETELADLKSSQAKASAERAAAAQREAARKSAAKAEAASQAQADAASGTSSSDAAAQRAEAAQRSAAKAASERALGAAQGRGDDLAAQLANARAQAAAAQAQTPAESPSPAATTAAKPATPSLASLLAPTQRQFGLYTTQAPFNWAEFDDVKTKVGTSPTMVGYFQGWDGPFRPDAVTRAWQRGMMPLLTWESRPLAAANDQAVDPDYSLPKIINGDYDAYLHQYAKDIAALGLPLGIRLDHEMNGSWYPWGERAWGGNSLNGNGKGDYVKMWRHVHDIFEAEGAHAYVVWIWAPNIVNALPSWAKSSAWYMRSLYPGDDYVDWVGLSGYFRPPYKADQTPTFDYTFGRSLAQLRSFTDKPILLAEIGASEIGNNKPAWVTDLFDAFTRPENDDIIGIAWFNQTVTTISGGQRVTNDWRIASRGDSLEAFSAGVANPAAGFVGTVAERDAARAETASPTPTPTSTTAAPAPTGTATGTESAATTATATASADPTETATATVTPTPTPTGTGTATATAEPSEEPSSSPAPTDSGGPSVPD
ncbi:MAG: glycoside hydrolase [Cellulomonas sp.]|nr:glycoside hydrolase [Cellulomonas sp.]